MICTWDMGEKVYNGIVKYLTKQEQFVLCLTIALVLAGWAVKVYRAAHPPVPAVWQQKL